MNRVLRNREVPGDQAAPENQAGGVPGNGIPDALMAGQVDEAVDAVLGHLEEPEAGEAADVIGAALDLGEESDGSIDLAVLGPDRDPKQELLSRQETLKQQLVRYTLKALSPNGDPNGRVAQKIKDTEALLSTVTKTLGYVLKDDLSTQKNTHVEYYG
ncbi:hypothetical protein MP638_003053 [Amoeboaphelidium occidentale]|nr:hypothetical protein MP638_003053 [Amoeboaphelidium occidentale]